MKYTVTFKEADYVQLTDHLFQDRSVERAAYALCRISESENETRLLVREIIPVTTEIEKETATEIVIGNRSFLKAMKRADETKHVFLFIHSHPQGALSHSTKDDIEERKLFKLAYNRISTNGVHGSLVLSDLDKPIGRIWLKNNVTVPVDLIRVIGSQFRFFTDLNKVDALPLFFDRQIRAFGTDVQKTLQILNIGVVGLGGTGSSVVEQLTRLGVGTLTIIDGQKFEKTNVNRLYGSSINDDGLEKITIAKNNIDDIDVGTKVIPYDKPITFLSSIEKLKNCDVVFGCTDDQWGRSILTRLAVYYHIPVFDMGVRIYSKEGTIESIQGRVTTLLGEYACLMCRERINHKTIEAEVLHAVDTTRLVELQREKYANELEETSPAVIPFTTSIAAAAVSELIQRLTGYMGADRKTNEIIMFFDETKLSRNVRYSNPECFCGDKYYLLRGDTKPLLDLTWRDEE